MSHDISIEQQPPYHSLENARSAPMWKIPKLLSEDFPRLDRHITAHGGVRSGAPYVRYQEIDWPEMRHCGPLRMLWQMLTTKQAMRIGMAVEAPVESDGDIEASSFEAMTCVRTIHRGPYQKVGETYKVIVDWAENNNVKLADYTMENYINDPTTVAKEDIETLILIPVVDEQSA
jgi:AraC family transcriptional regulator